MVKKCVLIFLAWLLAASAAVAEMTVERKEGQAYFPSESEWTYHFTYAYPHLIGDDYASAVINDTYQMALDEMINLVLPMFAHEEEMLFDGKNEIIHDFEVTCNNGEFLSILQRRSQTLGEEGTLLTMEAQVFDVAGNILSLRGLVMVGESSAQIAQGVLPILYEKFQELQAAGICPADVIREDFELEFAPTQNFYADEVGNAVFFFPPTLLREPSFEVPTFTFTPAQLKALLPEIPAEGELQ